MAQKAIMISGPLTEADLAELTAAMRMIEQRNPEGLYKAMIIELARDPSLEEMAATLERIFPRLPGAEPLFATAPRPTKG
jgi:hypothetical protein